MDFLLLWVFNHTLVLGVGFAIGLAAGLKIPIIGDAIAMLLVGLLLILTQNYMLSEEFDISGNWILYSFIGLIIGVAGSFLFILFTDKLFGLKDSHIFSLPISLVVLTLFQALLLKNQFSSIYIWPATSLLALVLAALVLYVINSQYDLAFDLLATRKPEFTKIPVWGFSGSIIGLIYGIITGISLTR